jgi:predicted permease
MKIFRAVFSRIAGLFGRESRDAELDAELASHLEMHIEDYLRSGMSPEEARRQARIKLGGVEQVKEAYRAQRGVPFLETIAQDLRFGLRAIRKNVGFTIVAVLTLALGIGANTALFSVVNGVLLNPLPYFDSNSLAILYGKTTQFDQASVSYPNYLDWEKNNKSFSSMAAFRDEDFNLTGQGEAERLHGYMVSAAFFPTLGVSPVAGSLFSRADDQVGGAPMVLIGEGLWKRKFGRSPSTIGKAMTLNGIGYTIVGVIPAKFRLYSGDITQVYVPIGQWNDPAFRNRRIGMGMRVIGRLKPGVTLEQARADMDRVSRDLAAAYPESNSSTSASLSLLKDDMVGKIAPVLLILLGAVAFVLLIACANVASLLLARSTGRMREFAVRSAMGASRSRLIRQLLTESALLAFLGGAVGLVVAAQGTKVILTALPSALPRVEEIGIDARVLLFTSGVAVLAAILFGVAPAFRIWHTNLQETLKEGGRGATGAHNRTQSVFVILEMATALVLLVGAGLMIRSLAVLWGVSPGFNPHNVLSMAVTMPPGSDPDPARTRAALRQLHDQIRNLPGVTAASVTAASLPMSGDSELPFWREGKPKPASDSEMNWALFYLIESDYLKTMQISLKRGRFLSDQDNERTAPVVVIDENLATRYFPNEDPVGKRLNLGLLEVQPEIVGVVAHVKHWGLDTDAESKIQSQMYLPFMQIPDRFIPLLSHGVGLVLRSENNPSLLLPAIRHAVAKMNSEQVVYGVQTLDEIVADSLAARRFSMILLGVFAGVSLLLASIGIYGVISYVVGQRIQEIGTRMALGAQRQDVLRLILGKGALLSLIGVALGSALALVLTREMRKMIYGVSANDPLTFIGVSLLLIIVALAACYVPARRAMRVDPMAALRYE